MKVSGRHFINFLIIFGFGLVPAIICQFIAEKPTGRHIHIRSFRYGKDPYVIRCNRGDTLHLTFSTDDTGHSFFLQEFDIDVKITPSSDEVTVFKTSDPTSKPVIEKEVTLIAKHPGLYNYIVSKSNYRCHVWCGPMHAFEQGKLIILPNTLMVFSLCSLLGILFIWLITIFKDVRPETRSDNEKAGYKDLLKKSGFLRGIVLSRYTQAALTLITMVMIYIVILTSVFGTKVSGRNIGVLLMWAVWLFALVAIITPFFGRFWCTICPLPFFGDLIQRKSFFNPLKGKTKKFNNKFSGLFLKWPEKLKNDWLRLLVFLLLATFSTTLVATPFISGITVLMLMLVPTLMSGIWELRAFCRYVCPVSVFVSPFSRMSTLSLRNKSQDVCDQCKPNYCEKGNTSGWACPYGLNVGEIKENSDCGLCLECMRSCTYNNVSLFRRPVASERGTRNIGEAWMTMATFTISIIYCILYLGPWPFIRDYVNILDKHNWDLFGIYSLVMWTLVLIIVPGIIYLLSLLGLSLAKTKSTHREVFLEYAGSLLPFAMMNWIAFVIPMLFVNVTFIKQSLSDPFGWGWDFFGTANTPWHQFLPQFIPWFQAVAVLTGLYLSLRNVRKSRIFYELNPKQVLNISLPISLFLTGVAIAMLVFFTN
ncbi:MAG: 4Fe-4S binding protein [Bacteroidales bacterium]|jgi:polyferredoxin